MDWKNHELFLCILLVFCGLGIANSARQNPLKDPKICGRPECDIDNLKFHYNDQLRYIYDYKMHIRTEFFGTGQNKSDLYFTGKVKLIFPKNCEGILTLTDIEIKEELNNDTTETVDNYYDDNNESITDTIDSDYLHSKSKQIAYALQENKLRFSYHDGLIGEVCPSSTEPIWVLNFKKGILSSLQNTMLRFDVDLNTTETDISGICNVHYNLEGADGTNVLIHKYKNIESCRNRNQMHSILQTTPYNFRDNREIWPILNTESYCNITVDHNIYQSVKCFESHQLIPFSQNQTGAITISNTELSLISEEPYRIEFVSEEDLYIKKRSTLLFDQTPTPKPTHGEIRASRDLLKEMCTLGFPDIKPEFIDIFTKFLQTTRLLQYKALHQLLTRSSSICGNGRNHVLESLPYIGSTASYQLMRDQIVNSVISKDIAQNWMTSMTFISRPDDETLETFYTILQYGQKKIDPEYTLGATAVVHTFCRHNSDCDENETVLKIINHLQDEYLKLLQSNNQNERRIKERSTIVLKGLGNIGVMTKDFVEKLKILIVDDKTLPIETRLQLILAFRRTKCIDNREFFLNVYKDFKMNSEIRIFSYLQAMTCPDYISVHIIKDVLENEEINQVGSFVWSHLTNIAKSASPVRIEAQGLLLNDNLGTKFKMDIRKYSRNYEYSIFFDEYNFGTSTDANLIFGTDSYLPRITTLNFTADLFGESVNFFEISTRTQGFEQLVTSIFGPNGPLNTAEFRKKFSFITKYFDDDDDDSNNNDILNLEKFRLRRDTNQQDEEEDYKFESIEQDSISQEKYNKSSGQDRQNKIYENIDKLGYKLKYDHGQPRATIGLKVFGNDLKYFSYDGMGEIMGTVRKFNPIMLAGKLLSGKEISYSKSGVFLDTSYKVPMSSGLPLSIHVFGASSIDLRLSGSFRHYKNTGVHLDVSGNIKPSVSVDVITTMEADFFYASSGIRVKSNFYSSSSFESFLKIRGSNLVSLTFNLPQNKNEIFSAKSELLVIKDAGDIPQPGIEKRSSNSTCTWPILDSAVGIRMCANYSLPDVSKSLIDQIIYPSLVLSGPIDLSIHLDKTDTSIKAFTLEYKNEMIDNQLFASFVFATPGSVIQRIAFANFTRDKRVLNATMSFILGKNSHSAVGIYIADPNNRQLEFYIENNGKRNIAFDMLMNRTQINNGWIYYPGCTLLVNNEIKAAMRGTIKSINKTDIEQNVIDLSFETKQLQVKLNGFLTRTEIRTLTKLSAEYRFNTNETQQINFESELANRNHKTKIDLHGMVKLFTTAYPKLNFASNATWITLLAHTEAKLTYNNAIDFENPNYTTTLHGIFSKSEREPDKKIPSRIRASIELIRPITNLNLGISIKHSEYEKLLGPSHVLYTILKYAPQKQATGVFLVQIQKRKLLAFEASMNISVPEFDSCTAQLNLIEVKAKNYTMFFNGNWFTKHSILINGSYNNLGARSNQHHILNFNISSPSFANTNITLLYKRNDTELISNLQTMYNNNPYDLSIYYQSLEYGQKRTKIITKIIDKIYSMSAKFLTTDNKLLSIELHLDKIRDILLNIRGLTKKNKNEVSLELKWDANRDPTQRLAISAEYNKPGRKKYEAAVMMTYPDRTFTCGFNSYTGGPNYYGDGRISWNTNDALILKYDAGLLSQQDITNGWVHAELRTPFDGWFINSYDIKMNLTDHVSLFNTSLIWGDNQELGIIYKSNFSVIDPMTNFEISLDVNSTVVNVPKIKTHIKYFSNNNQFKSSVGFGYTNVNNTMIMYNLDSDWSFDGDAKSKIISGKLLMKSPFEGYRFGNLLAKISWGSNRVINAHGRLILENKLFALDLDGYVKKFTDNMLQLDIKTPIEKYKHVTGRFGLNEFDRHAVAQISAPIGSLGVEILLQINNFGDFDVKLSCATPIDSFKWIAIYAKIKPDTMDWRGGYNNVTIGFTGIWKMYSLNDFEYSYRVFTPLKNFEDNGIVIKYLNNNNTNQIISEAYGQLSTYKLGWTLNGKPMSELLKRLGVTELKQYSQENNNFPVKSDEIDDEFENLFSCVGKFELDTIIYPTITGTMRIQELTDFYVIVGNVKLATGNIDILDYVYYPHMLNIENILKINTPFNLTKEIQSKFQYNIEFSKMYVAGLEFSYTSDNDNWNDLGYFVNYTIINETDSKTHEIDLTVKTPFELLRRIDITGLLELEELTYRINFTTKTDETKLSVNGGLEIDENFLDASLGISLDTKIIPHYGYYLFFKKEFGEMENIIHFGFDIDNNGMSNKLNLLTKWNPDYNNNINVNCRLETNLLPLKIAETNFLMTKLPNPMASFDMSLVNQSGHRTEFSAKANRKKDLVNIELQTPIEKFNNISIMGILTRDKTSNNYVLKGDLIRNSEHFYSIEGVVILSSEFPVTVNLLVKPRKNGPTGVIKFSVENTEGDYGKTFQFSSIEDGKMCQIAGGYSIRSHLDWELSILVQSTELEISRINLNTKLKPIKKGTFIGNFDLETPWKHLGIETVKFNTNIDVTQETGKIYGDYEIENQIGKGLCTWTWLLMENMQLALETSTERLNAGTDSKEQLFQVNVRYTNPNKNFQRFAVGSKLNIDYRWLLEVNTSMNLLSQNDIFVGLITKLPAPIGDIHHLSTRYRGNLIEHVLGERTDPINVFAEAKYDSVEAKRKFLSNGSYRNVDDLQGIGRIEWGKDEQQNTVESNFQMLRKGKNRREFYAKLITPYYQKEDSVFLSGNYDKKNNYYLFSCSLNSPASRQLAETDVSYRSFTNLKGFVNSTVPFFNLTWLRGDFNFTTNLSESLRYVKTTWPTNSAFVKLQSSFSSKDLNRDLQGTIAMEVPLATRHYANIEYDLKERNQLNTGHANVNYNGKMILNGQYNCKTEERAGFEKNVVDISLENYYKPLGIYYVHSKQYTNAEFSDFDTKHVEIYELRKSNLLNITGELQIRTTDTGQDYKIIAIHRNRTVILNSEYDYKNFKSKQKSKLQLSPTAWISYNVEVINNTTPTNESQNFLIELSYPKRSLSVDGWYFMTHDIFDSDMLFKWGNSRNKKFVRSGFKWNNEPLNHNDKDHQTALLTIGHPSFTKEISFKALYRRSVIDLLKAQLLVDYCDDPEHLIDVNILAKDLYSEVGYANFSIQMAAIHNASLFEATTQGSAAAKMNYYHGYFNSLYKRGYYPESHGLLLGKLDLNNKEIEYERISPFKHVRFWAIPYRSYPFYGINATVWDSPGVNSTGYFYIDLKNRFTRMEINITPDATQNLQMIGYIPDARSGYFDIWRNYEEIRVIDVASFLRMNHSRLVSGQFNWRPKLKMEVKELFKQIGSSFYDSFAEGIDFWIKNMYQESTDSINDIWYKSKEKTKIFLDDMAELKVLEDDIQEFRSFLNNSFEANDFYIKTLVNLTLNVLDELAIRDSMQSVPIIINEIWQMMGKSGKAIRESIVQLIETIKKSYHHALEILSRFFHGESLEHLSKIMEKAVEKYDKFVKDLHISFIKYIEHLWTKASNMASNFWQTFLKTIEPHVFKFIHYIEKAAWKFSKEIFDFINNRTNEIAEAPYFSHVSNFTRDLDLLYKDVQSNDLITNLRKYSGIAWKFIKDKYFKLIPFAKELDNVSTELWNEVKSLQKLTYVQKILEIYNEIYMKIEWICDELQIDRRIHQLWRLIRNKIGSYTMTALQTDDMYREAKTKFIFDPDVGTIELVQKLPMSWHAFNETPKFEEIPEYQIITNIQDFFGGTNFSLIQWAYTIKTNMDPKTWLPPYNGHSLLIGSRHYITFDKKHVGLDFRYEVLQDGIRQDQCSYLLAHDFYQKNFTLLLEPSIVIKNGIKVSSKKLSLITNGNYLEIDIAADSLLIGNKHSPILPLKIDNTIIYRDHDILIIKSEEDFTLNCNLQFDLCWFELGSWYYGQTAGLLGTMNNELFDDYTTSRGTIVKRQDEFIKSWEINGCVHRNVKTNQMQEISFSSEVKEMCHEFFKTSYFPTCFDHLDPRPFYDMCLDMGSNSISSTLKDHHPAQKGACTAVLGYIEACEALKIPLRVPDKCVHCNLPNGSYVAEGTFITLNKSDIPSTTDVVFIIEAKPCNKNLTKSKNIMTVVASLDQELKSAGLTNNRYAVLTFGGRAPFDKPHTVVYKNQIFTSNPTNLKHYFDHIDGYNGLNNDTFGALSIASKLIFRPGASKTFILLPCSSCSSRDMKLDYISILQLMLEESIKLHILMDQEFIFDKPRLDRVFFGIDRDLAYSKRDLKEFTGDAELRKQVRVPKNALGYCTQLAIETNGTVFTSRKLSSDKQNPIKKLSTIFAKRVAKTAQPDSCQTCECTGHNNGIAYMICNTCYLPIADGFDDDGFDLTDVDLMETSDWNDYDDKINDD